jgi:hypothetical protein
MSSKEMGTLAPPSGSPYAYMLTKKSELENSMRQRLLALRESAPHALHQDQQQSEAEGSTNSSKCRRETSNELRNRRRAEHAKAVVDDLCEVVADLFLSESKLLNPRNYGVLDQIELPNDSGIKRERTVNAIRNFVSTLPLRYALGVDTPSEVLLHMRLVAAVRSDKTKAAIHIHNIEEDSNWCLKVAAESARHNHSLRLVTISCHDATGLLEYISRLLATGGSRVLDADVMLSTEGIALVRLDLLYCVSVQSKLNGLFSFLRIVLLWKCLVDYASTGLLIWLRHFFATLSLMISLLHQKIRHIVKLSRNPSPIHHLFLRPRFMPARSIIKLHAKRKLALQISSKKKKLKVLFHWIKLLHPPATLIFRYRHFLGLRSSTACQRKFLPLQTLLIFQLCDFKCVMN